MSTPDTYELQMWLLIYLMGYEFCLGDRMSLVIY